MAGLVSICCCAGGRLMSLGRPSPSLLLIVLFGGSESGMARV